MILSVDLGSTSFKAAVFDRGLNRMGSGAAKLEYLHGSEGRVEIEPEAVPDALRRAIEAALSSTNPSGLSAIALTSQAQTFTVTDEAGTPRISFLSWMDNRATAACASLSADPALDDVAHHASFPRLFPGLQLCQLRRLRDEQPGLLIPSHRIAPLPSFIAEKWTGVSCCDRNLAAMSGLYSMKLGDWWPAALRSCGITSDQLPSLVDIGQPAGRTTEAAQEFGIPAGLPVILAGNDQTAGAFGAGIHKKDALLITLGTCQVAYRVSASAPSPERRTVAGPYPGGWYTMTADSCGGNLVNWAGKVLAGCGTDEDYFRQAESAASGCGGVVFEIGPRADDNGWLHTAARHTPGDLARAVIESLVNRMCAMVDTLTGGRPPPSMLVAGGGSNAPLWVGMLSEALGQPLIVTEADPLAGAAGQARQALSLNNPAVP